MLSKICMPLSTSRFLNPCRHASGLIAIRATVADAGGVTLRPENAFQLLFVVSALVGEAYFLPAMRARIARPPCRSCPAQETAESCRQQTALDVVFLDAGDNALDAAQRRVPDLRRCLDRRTDGPADAAPSSLSGVRNPALRPEELPPRMFFRAGRPCDRCAGTPIAALTPANPPPTITTSQLIALRERRAIFVRIDQQSREPPVLIDDAH